MAVPSKRPGPRRRQGLARRWFGAGAGTIAVAFGSPLAMPLSTAITGTRQRGCCLCGPVCACTEHARTRAGSRSALHLDSRSQLVLLSISIPGPIAWQLILPGWLLPVPKRPSDARTRIPHTHASDYPTYTCICSVSLRGYSGKYTDLSSPASDICYALSCSMQS